MIQVAETVKKLHQRNIYHRDIKPANILVYGAKLVLADFGLVDYPNKKEVSRADEEIGPKWTMAPEMRRESSTAKLGPADIYSLAKTLWILLTGKPKGFDGQYSSDSIMALKKFCRIDSITLLDDLLSDCTNNDPDRRPNIDQLINRLRHWQKFEKHYYLSKLQQWQDVQKKLFPSYVPSRVMWNDVNEIIHILKLICSYKDINYVFFPISGGLDLKDIRTSHEKDCIELDCGQIHIVKPHILTFESFGFHHEWNYFRLECSELRVSKVNETSDEYIQEVGSEELTELSPGNYYPYAIYANPEFYAMDYNITSSMRRIRRWLRGSFVIFCKSSAYNLTPGTADGRHNEMNALDFRFYIYRIVCALRKRHEEVPVESKSETVKNRDLIEKEIVYRCNNCGDVVSESGATLSEDQYDYNKKVLRKYGMETVKNVRGLCCID